MKETFKWNLSQKEQEESSVLEKTSWEIASLQNDVVGLDKTNDEVDRDPNNDVRFAAFKVILRNDIDYWKSRSHYVEIKSWKWRNYSEISVHERITDRPQQGNPLDLLNQFSLYGFLRYFKIMIVDAFQDSNEYTYKLRRYNNWKFSLFVESKWVKKQYELTDGQVKKALDLVDVKIKDAKKSMPDIRFKF